MSDFISDFRAAMANAGLVFHGEIVADKKIHRFKPEDATSGEPGWYQLHPDGIPAGAFGDWRNPDNTIKWHHANGDRPKLTDEELSECRKKWRQAELARNREEAERHERFAKKAEEYVGKLGPALPTHLYLVSKGVGVHGELKQGEDGSLVLPLKDAAGKVWSFQKIDFSGSKQFMPGGRVQGCHAFIGELSAGPLVVCEGYATGASIHQATGWPVVCAMNCGNLKQVCHDLREKHPSKLLVIAADDDRFTKQGEEPRNPGMEKATAAAEEFTATVVKPAFAAESKGTDFNDMAKEAGLSAVRNVFHSTLGIGMGKQINLRDLLFFVPGEDPNAVLGNRYLCRGGSCAIVAQTSVGKSSLSMQMAVLWALGLDFFGLKSPRGPLRSVIVQAENDEGDAAEMFQGIILGLGLVDPNDVKGANELLAKLQKNLIIIRDQTHMGSNFARYAEKLVEIHKPDLFWIDPLLSFYGGDINDQKEMSLFLRSELNPISERTGIIWFAVHHTGKPAKEDVKAKSKSARDYAYLGIGSSELSNWARAIITVVATSDDEFRMIFAKRGRRAGIVDDYGNPAMELNLAHSGEHICWRRIQKPKSDEDMGDIFSNFSRTITTPMKATAIVKMAAQKLSRGERTVWSFWDSGEGPLGLCFKQVGEGLWVAKSSKSGYDPYGD